MRTFVNDPGDGTVRGAWQKAEAPESFTRG